MKDSQSAIISKYANLYISSSSSISSRVTEDNNTFLINTPRGTLAVNLDALTFKIKLNYEEGTLFDDKELTRVSVLRIVIKT